ncbi:putative mitogen-activated protein kinase kinase kinase STE-STE11 family [Arabidopsis thaliana]|uniref:Protein kinase superfamily protein n=4 Tax=Arabidopsis TaxID=3701 RepID=Q3E909_ARATH|nr:Protein kinase superfamily protein [Arabidopsis thaliana]KAG7603654.1 Protein kinase domain [Arabidopsis thaliana x Arabidopsis arenosa]KAG7610579.1 Protein kinase domain [Arabidopsis suecica]AED93695.1 Protein kinase superfamily protein [Arabidopsis thaliana]OAO94661.1 hypothetical protein AXX17_AT5G27420 [Arabidopsis thaliana]CAD5332833.1 unnamed protein product [Arabidopsis thaliana]|eukprot:NP_198103.1 Protein kinase superfamily protein [Arabidopsis thaliana]
MKLNEEYVKFLGEGAYSFVDLFKYTKSDGSSFHAAVKSSDDENSLLKEFHILSELKGCPRIIQCFGNDLEEGFDDKGNRVYKLLLEYASEGSLSDFMNNCVDRKLPDLMIRDFTRMILQGLVSIHSHGYVHCDLKPENVLVFPCGDSYEVKISDFGLSLQVGEVPDHWKIEYPFVGTLNYMPPESLHDGVANKTLDLWSLGCLVLEMYVCKKPWIGFIPEDFVYILSNGNPPEIPESLPCDARAFIQKCFSRNPKERGTASELLSHRFLRQEKSKLKMISPFNLLKFKKFLNKLLRLKNFL